MTTDEVVVTMPGLELLEEARGVSEEFWIRTGGLSAFGGALRIFPSKASVQLPSMAQWNDFEGWRGHYRHLAPRWPIIGEDSFGTQYLLDPEHEQVSIFWAETAEIEAVGVSPAEFLEMIIADPEETISLRLYQQCVGRYGELQLRQHFAFRVELAVGGSPEVNNIVVMTAAEHMVALASIALQIREIPLKSQLTPTRD